MTFANVQEVATQEQSCFMCGAAETAPVCVTKDFCYETCSNEFRYERCTACGHTYLKNRPVLAALDIIYPSNYLTFDYKNHLGGLIYKLRNLVQKAKTRYVAKYAQPHDAVLDVGCGGGDFLDLLKKFGDPSWKLFGVDFSDKAGEVLKSRGLGFVHSRFETMDWNGPAIGVVVMNQLIEHVENPEESVRKAFDILRPGGVLIMETPNLKSWDCTLFKKRHWGGWHAPRHWNVFDAETLERCVKKAGFEVAEVGYTLNPFGWLHSMQYLLRDVYGLEKFGRLFDVDKVFMLAAASCIDVLQIALTRRSSNMRFIARKPAKP